MDIILVLNENIYIQILIYFYISHNYIFYFYPHCTYLLCVVYFITFHCVFHYFVFYIPFYSLILYYSCSRERDCITRNESSREGA